MANVLIIDDDPDFCYALSRAVSRMGHEAVTAGTAEEGYRQACTTPVDAVFLDVRLPDGNGLSLMPRLGRLPEAPEIIIITGAGDPDGAELAISNGAWDYIDKGNSAKAIILTLRRALEYRSERLQAAAATTMVALRRDAIIGTSPAINHCLDQLAQAAPSDVNVLITGETGTGKELFARAIHDNSPRSGGPFVVVDCAALTETLTESLLFGHRKGAFTGAHTEKTGLILQAQGGTLFLDEVGELPPDIQKAFLRVLQERRVRPVGGSRERPCDFRLVAATNRDLEAMVADGGFRRDLFFRIQSFSIVLPPLRDRLSDLRRVAAFHINRICERFQREQKGIANGFYEILEAYPWPGNVRELVNVLEQAVVTADSAPTLYRAHLPVKLRVQVKQAALSETGPAAAADRLIEASDSGTRKVLVEPTADPDRPLPPFQQYREQAFSRAEKDYLEQLMARSGGNVKSALSISGMSQSRLYALLKKHGLTPGR